MTDRLLAKALSALLRYIAKDPERWLNVYRQIRKLIAADNPQHAREGILAIAKALDTCYNDDVS